MNYEKSTVKKSAIARKVPSIEINQGVIARFLDFK
jgi:hypothetical protein